MTKKTYETNYRDKLNNFREFLKNDTGKSSNCIEILQGQIEIARSQLTGKRNSQGENLDEVLVRTLSKDLSRYYDSFTGYQKSLSDMGTTENQKILRRKIVSGDKDFFKETWKEDSDNFFRTRKFISSYLKDLSLVSGINASLDCLVTSLYRYTLHKYGK